VKAADDCGLAATAVLDSLIEDWSVMRSGRLQVPEFSTPARDFELDRWVEEMVKIYS